MICSILLSAEVVPSPSTELLYHTQSMKRGRCLRDMAGHVWRSYRFGGLSSSVPNNSSQQGQLVHKAGGDALLYFPALLIQPSHQPVTAAHTVSCQQHVQYQCWGLTKEACANV